jgi:hypothetical protein
MPDAFDDNSKLKMENVDPETAEGMYYRTESLPANFPTPRYENQFFFFEASFGGPLSKA